MKETYTKNHYQIAEKISWDDVIEKASKEFSLNDIDNKPIIIWNGQEIHASGNDVNQNQRIVYHDFKHPPTFFLQNGFGYYPGTLGEVFDFIKKDCGVKVLHVYFSFGEENMTFGNHYDPVDVLLVQAKGSMKYKCGENLYSLNPGDSLLLPKGVYHEPISVGPRITLSFSWE